MRTVFNILGPLVNPAGATIQIVGTTTEHNARLVAEAQCLLGLHRGFVVHGRDGLDEVTTTAETIAFEVREGRVERHVLTPEDFGLPRASLEQIAGGLAPENAEIARRVLAGEPGPARDIVVANAGLALVAAERAASFAEGARLAEQLLDSGEARLRLERLAGR
jgi:anthranilate phosphoribosyltransferase